ncbi:MAG TPA: hypothetical protein VHL57_01605, partial [Flavobacteriales bacterium]|nr:hypothetical protein [Flavobacteriales bacterium]
MERLYQRTIFLFLCSLFMSLAHAQEICTNGIDDDADGLIDLNDTTDCLCGPRTISSIIPNPSFEQFDCLPSDFTELSCADSWEQATDATTDYFHSPSFMPTAVPQPMPDGTSCAGGIALTNWEEYLGVCLNGPMVAGTTYHLQLWVAG